MSAGIAIHARPGRSRGVSRGQHSEPFASWRARVSLPGVQPGPDLIVGQTRQRPRSTVPVAVLCPALSRTSHACFRHRGPYASNGAADGPRSHQNERQRVLCPILGWRGGCRRCLFPLRPTITPGASVRQDENGGHSGQLLRVAALGRMAPPACGSPRGCGHLAAKQARAASGCRRLSTQRGLPGCLPKMFSPGQESAGVLTGAYLQELAVAPASMASMGVQCRPCAMTMLECQ